MIFGLKIIAEKSNLPDYFIQWELFFDINYPDFMCILIGHHFIQLGDSLKGMKQGEI